MSSVAVVGWSRRHPDALLTGAALALMLITSVSNGEWRHPSGWSLVLVGLAWLPLTVRTRWPLPVAAAVVSLDAAHIALAAHGHPATAIVPVGSMLALYTVSVRYPARVAWSAAAIGAAVLLTMSALTYPHVGPDLLYVNWALIATAIGRLVLERRDRIAAAEQRAEAAERSKQAEARRQVTDERMRIAHELHDVLAHHIAVVNAQAGVAQYLLRTDPDAANKALAGIADNTRAALDELRATLGLLRAERGDTDADEERAPTPTADQLDTLLDRFRAAGMQLSVQTRGTPQQLSGPADLALYRIVQESLTNASKHGPGNMVRLDIDWCDDAVTFAAANTRPAITPPTIMQELVNEGTGHGLLGMRERAAAAGGTLDAGPLADGG